MKKGSHYQTQLLFQVLQALDKVTNALNKHFAECYIRQRLHNEPSDGKGFFAECFLSDTRQRLCQVLETLGKKNTQQNKKTRKIEK
jgi:hypothetical protein